LLGDLEFDAVVRRPVAEGAAETVDWPDDLSAAGA
jgi:hypothetical protein